jgi:hypothetical protein
MYSISFFFFWKKRLILSYLGPNVPYYHIKPSHKATTQPTPLTLHCGQIHDVARFGLYTHQSDKFLHGIDQITNFELICMHLHSSCIADTQKIKIKMLPPRHELAGLCLTADRVGKWRRKRAQRDLRANTIWAQPDKKKVRPNIYVPLASKHSSTGIDPIIESRNYCTLRASPKATLNK